MFEDKVHTMISRGCAYEDIRAYSVVRPFHRKEDFEECLSKSVYHALAFIFPINLAATDRNMKDEYEKDLSAHSYIPYHNEKFVDTIKRAAELVDGDVHFIDCGCGPGEKVFLAKYGAEVASATGIEYNEMTYNMGRFFLRRTDGCTLIHGDAFEFDFRPYNLVYLYRPIADLDNVWKLYQHVWATMPEGGIFVEVYMSARNYHQFHGVDWAAVEEAKDFIDGLPDGEYCLGCDRDRCERCVVYEDELEEAQRLYDDVIEPSRDYGYPPHPFVLRKVNGEMVEVEL